MAHFHDEAANRGKKGLQEVELDLLLGSQWLLDFNQLLVGIQ